MTYEEFLQTPAKFVDDLAKILELKGKWGLSLTPDEKMLRRHLRTLQLRSKVSPLPSETPKPSDCQLQFEYIQAFIKKHGISLETADHLRRCFEELERMEKLAACNQASPSTHQAQS